MKDVQRGKRPYIYTNFLRFLDPVLNEKNIENQTVFLDEQSFEDQNETWLPPSFVDMEEAPSKKPKLDATAKDYLEITESDNDNLVSILARLVNREDDEDRAFFTSIVPSVKSLTENAKLEFKIQVMKLLKEIKMKDKSGAFIKLRDSDSD
ncbi:jg2707 [Pararge aegeria aegeria]|uniref:Jg2707 protein n=2 Tax=Pararge aegeria TaxID=116150 RepID=A0A8S4QXL4_9NEOP|nr:jg2707 [Pararge aegeria aegeria]